MRHMTAQWQMRWLRGVFTLLLVQLCATVLAGERKGTAVSDKPSPWQDDAQLHDVQFIGSKIGWAVGEHGAIWQTTDGGQNWKFKPCPVDIALHSVCFLTDKVGWIVGGGSIPYTKISVGVVLYTADGGATWQQLARDVLPELHRGKFFTLEKGFATGQTTAAFPSGVMVTEDGGRTWQNVPGEGATGWRAADFLNPEIGAVAGPQGRMSTMGNGRLLSPRTAEIGLRGLYAIKLQAKEPGWLVGDGGLVLCTRNQGSVWQSPAALLPEAVAEIFDFRAVCFRGKRGWIAGQPGSVIWHTPDGGATWQKQATQQPLPISAITFTSDLQGCAVGAMGLMLRTDDGGESWQGVRGHDRRAAYLALHGRTEQVSLPVVTALSGEGGYRGVVAILPRRDLGPDGYSALDLDLRLREAVNLTGGAEAEVSWRFPIAIAGLDQDAEKLVADWNQRTEGKLATTMLGQLVCQIRTWRPSVLILDKPVGNDPLTQIVHDALLLAVEQAADPTRFIAHQELADLQPWQVQKVYARLASGSNGQVSVDPHEFLPRTGASVQAASALASGRLFSKINPIHVRETYSLVLDHNSKEGAARKGPSGNFFSGLNLTPGSDARRILPPLSGEDLEARMKTAKRQRDFHGILDQYSSDPRFANQMVGNLDEIVRGLPPEQAALQLAQLAELYRRTGKWDLAEQTMIQLVERYEHQPAAREGMRWLLQMWISAEATFRRSQLTTRDRQQISTDFEQLASRIRNATARYEEGSSPVEVTPEKKPTTIQQTGGRTLLKSDTEPGLSEFNGVQNLKGAAVRKWQEDARHIAQVLERTAPAYYQSPEIQFPLAALYRQRTLYNDANEVYQAALRGGGKGPWQRAALAELWLQRPLDLPPKAFIVCRPARERPWLDGSIADACWQDADEIPLAATESAAGDSQTRAFALMCYDQEFLYLAASFPRVAGAPADLAVTAGRRHDSDLSQFDRVTLTLDVDRDYVTANRFSVDQRGLTAEDSCDDRSWDPQWFVAMDTDASGWRIEIAIPFKEMVPEAPRRGQVWGASLVRTIPAIGVESWSHPASSFLRLEAGGLIKFD